MPSFSIPLSGLNASSVALSAISNDIANLNTVGYKGTRQEFRDLFYQQVGSSGSGDPVQVGAGVGIGAISSVFTQGSIEASGVPTDVAIQGEGFFAVQDAGGLTTYTRAGNFSVNANGFLSTSSGSRVLGYPSINGSIDPNQPVAPISVSPGQVSPPAATSSMNMQMNLDAGAAVGSQFSSAVTVYDSLGASHILTANFTKTAANNWNWQLTIPGADVNAASAQTVATGSFVFDGTGKLTSPSSDISGLSINNLATGASPLSFTWALSSGGSQSITQVAAPSEVSATQQNGYASGTLVNFNISGDGTINGIFSNGRTAALGQIALATFPNDDGLFRTGNGGFLPTLASGATNIGVPGTGGRGTLSGGALELSNVDVASEFSQLILAQRGFQANARTVTTFDQVTQEAINLKQ